MTIAALLRIGQTFTAVDTWRTQAVLVVLFGKRQGRTLAFELFAQLTNSTINTIQITRGYRVLRILTEFTVVSFVTNTRWPRRAAMYDI
jgi:hypothetical protein